MLYCFSYAKHKNMHEHLSTTPDTLSPRLLNPADLGGMAVVTTVELPGIPEADVQQQESERKRNTTENLRVLQKRFGERFVKGDLMEGGGYTGGAARELMAGFMDRPGFADELKRLIPGKHGALALLKDNHAYIQATLEQRYKDDPGHERQPAKDPYELARSVGYELTGPFTSTSEFVPLDRQDFRPHERLCTFNSPAERLRGYNILWLRHAEVADTLPADTLTADTLSDAWKTYLKTIGRYDQASDSYDIAGLRPTRDDPYGTSSMSVQISRQGTHVSIKNRYNHTVGNPDNTLDSNLDNVAYGLKRAVYASVGREDLMSKTSVSLADKYCADNDGGIHAYKYEEDNVYYGDYEYISNGVVTTIDRGTYYMISPQLYVPKSGKGGELRLGQRNTGLTGLEVCNDVRFLYESSKSSTKGNEKDPRIAELRQAYAERDYAELKVLAVERIRESFETSYAGYNSIASQIKDISNRPAEKRRWSGRRHETGIAVLNKADMERQFNAKLAEWQQNGVLDYATERIITHGELHTPVFRPNVVVSAKGLKELANNFAKGQGFNSAYIYDELYDAYTSEQEAAQLSGYTANPSAVAISLIPSKTSQELGYAPAETQLRTLGRLRTMRPSLNLRVPSVLDALTFWQTLRAGGDRLADSSTFDKTYIRHFDMKPQRLGGLLYVPRSCVVDFGKPAWTSRVPRVATMRACRWGKNLIFGSFFSSFAFGRV